MLISTSDRQVERGKRRVIECWAQGCRRMRMGRTYRPRASAVLPLSWAEAIAEMYRLAGHTVAIDPRPDARGEVKLTVQGLTQKALCQHLNDPLGKPGEQETWHPQTSRYRRKVKPVDAYTQALIDEERRNLRPDDDE
jgi:hypothetical protein